MPKGNGSPRKHTRKQSIKLYLPVPALSTNKMYSGRKTRSWHYKKFRKQVFALLKDESKHVDLSGNLQLSMDVGFSSPLSDLSNAQKSIEDIIAEYFEFNDRQIVSIKLEKFLVNKGDEFMRIILKKSKRDIDGRSKHG